MEYKVIIQHRDHIGYVVYTSSELITNAIMETNKYKEYLKRKKLKKKELIKSKFKTKKIKIKYIKFINNFK